MRTLGENAPDVPASARLARTRKNGIWKRRMPGEVGARDAAALPEPWGISLAGESARGMPTPAALRVLEAGVEEMADGGEGARSFEARGFGLRPPFMSMFEAAIAGRVSNAPMKNGRDGRRAMWQAPAGSFFFAYSAGADVRFSERCGSGSFRSVRATSGRTGAVMEMALEFFRIRADNRSPFRFAKRSVGRGRRGFRRDAIEGFAPMPLTHEQAGETEALRKRSVPTRRVVSEGMEEQLHVAHQVLDHGFVRVVDYMGDDSAIVRLISSSAPGQSSPMPR